MSSDKARGTHVLSTVEKDSDAAASGNAKRGAGRHRGGGGSQGGSQKHSGGGGGGGSPSAVTKASQPAAKSAAVPAQAAKSAAPAQAAKPVPSRAAGAAGRGAAAAKPVQPPVHKEGVEMQGKTKAISVKLSKFFFAGTPVMHRRRFELSEDEANMVTHGDRSKVRDELIKRLMTRVTGSIIMVDTHAGAGGDALLFMRILKELGCKAHLILTQPPCDNGREKRLRANVEAYSEVIASPLITVNVFADRFQDALSALMGAGTGVRIDFMNIDVPWDLPAGYTEASCRGKSSRAVEITTKIVRRIVDDVLTPLAENRVVQPYIICLKVPAAYEQYQTELKAATPYLRPYCLLRELPVIVDDRIRYYYIFLLNENTSF